MKIDGRLFIVFIIVLALIPGAFAITASTGGGSSVSGSGTAQGNLATNGVQTTGFSVANGAMSGTEDHWIGDITGKHAEVYFDVENAAKWSHDWTLSPGGKSKDQTIFPTAQSTISAKESLDVTNADSIQAGAAANNGEGDNANVLFVGDGSLTGYANSATATKTSADASETATSVSSNYWGYSLGAGNAEGDIVGYPLYLTTEKATVSQTTEKPGISNFEGFSGGILNGVPKSEATAPKSLDSLPATSLKNFKVTTHADIANAKATQNIGTVSSSYGFQFSNWAQNNKGDHVYAYLLFPNDGSLSGFSDTASANAKTATLSRTMTSASGSSINANANAGNLEGDNANVATDMGTGSLKGYSNTLTVPKTQATASQGVTSANCAIGANIIFDSSSNNKEGDHVKSFAELYGGKAPYSGLIGSYSNGAAATLASASTSQSANSISGDLIESSVEAGNSEGDVSTTATRTTQGKLSVYSDQSTAHSIGASSKTAITTATGSSVEITSTGSDKAKGYENQWDKDPTTGNWVGTLKEVDAGGANFAAKSIKFSKIGVTNTATQNDVTISTSGFGTKTALILDPRRNEFEDNQHNTNAVGGIDIRDTLMASLEKAGYAVTYYSDAAVSKEKVGQMDDYWVSVINTHANSYGFDLSKSSDGLNPDTVTASDLKYDTSHKNGLWKNSNGMTILTICNTFTNTGTGTLADAAGKASVSGGTTTYWSIEYSRKFLNNYFQAMADGGKTATEANIQATGYDWQYDQNGDAIPGAPLVQKSLTLRGSKQNFML